MTREDHFTEPADLKHIAIAGNIGAGKTTLCTKLGQHFGWDVHYESADDNPYLADFYNDMERWSFNLQVYFLHNRFAQIIEIQDGDRTVIQDRTIYEDAFIFAPNLKDMGMLTKRDFDNYSALFETMNKSISPPDLLIYLRAGTGTLVSHIQNRGREYEGAMSLNYLKKLNQRYEDWISDYSEGKSLIIDVDNLDFANKPEDLGHVVERVQSKLHGLF
ncbi:deoxynucleoside kinase [Neolewinella antarctica]|uniref:Deoxyadenosine/deoxycytidine kinase n=1 Tax=Neolewinella antarctica TaxID=442734 RepID=A0ABX0X6E9_9BACT|nr:deoxynucleoside kinase [Neolewinella antarctica]NJC24598.1 deoxyadenosine/deoxycytidine kinase [Neolewinella antarctica]